MEDIISLLIDTILSPPIFVPLIFPGLASILVVIILLIWLERKIAGKVQLRYGPLYVLKPLGGVIQLVADLLRYMFAEVILPKGADKKMFIAAPLLAFTFALLPVPALPVSPSFYAFRSEFSLLIVVALMTIAPIFIVIMGWASDNKFSFIGSLREGYVVMAYEIPLFVTILAMALTYNTLDIIDISVAQLGGEWGIMLNPLAAITYAVCVLIMTSRFPFEISEAEQELVIGPATEYSGIIFGLCMSYSYMKLYVLSLLFAYLFLGGWAPIIWPLTIHPILPGITVMFKGAIIMVIGIFMRSVYPRFRIDQLLKLGWRELMISSFASLLIPISLIGFGVLS